MELKVFKDTLMAAGGSFDAKAELPVEAEILIPDYLPQVFKIVKCFVHLVVLQKQVIGARVTLDGYLRCVVCYQAGEDQSLCQTEQKLPFTKTIEFNMEGTSSCQVQVGGELEYLNCRAVNQRRIDLRGAYALTVKVSCQVEQEIVTAVADCGAEQKLTLLSGIRPVACLDKPMTAEEEIAFPEQPAAVLDISGAAAVDEVKIISGKAVVKGRVQARVLYRTQPGYWLDTLRQEIPFNQIVDLDGVGEDCVCFAAVEPTGCTLMAGQEGHSTLSMNALLHLRAWRTVECYAVGDAFSTQYEMEAEVYQTGMEPVAARLEETVEAVAGGTLPDENAELIHCFVTLNPLELVPGSGTLQLRGRAVAHLLCMNSLGEIDCYDKAFEFTLPQLYEGAPEHYRAECWAGVSEVTVTKNGNEMNARVLIRVTGLVLQRRSETVLAELRCLEPLVRQDPEVALRICYAKQGENLFDIAKRYHVSPGAMKLCNRLEEPELTRDLRLLVPVVI